jgi:hypothetical protein
MKRQEPSAERKREYLPDWYDGTQDTHEREMSRRASGTRRETV